MVLDVKKTFEKRLQEVLKSNIDLDGVKFLRNEITVKKSEDAVGRIGFRFLSNANGYILAASADSADLQSFFSEIKPPYKPNIATGLAFAMNTSMEIDKLFSPNQGGAIALPRNEVEIESVCQWICGKVKDVYLPRVLRVLEADPRLVDDVLANPDYYSYPVLTIIFAVYKNNLNTDGLNFDYMLGKKVSKNKNYDAELLRKHGLLV
ncbi:hypothetical protein [Burkholderia sp. Ax-1719]|uniref:hypothetical protein n=1 Tax=Burkholderia sp. Ax-1719 TaxID=2608334 RepID=UPI001421E202|nr:hypothetical protein [Burkholderia sp. Ax-1719]NIE63555.1 hypothetical protein [Burkholderia sp. Ax-1719]